MVKEQSMSKSDLWQEDIITIVVVLSLVAFDYIHKEWKEVKAEGWSWGVLKEKL